MTVSYDTDEINGLSRANVDLSTGTLAPIAAASFLETVDVGLADVVALIASPGSLADLRWQLGEATVGAAEATANTAVLGAQLYHQAVLYVANETGLSPQAVVAMQLVERGRDAWAVAEDLYFGDITTADLTDDAEAAGPDRIFEAAFEVGGTYKIATGSVEVAYTIEQYGDVYRVVATITVYAGVGLKARDGVDVGVEQVVEVAWDVADADSAARLIARLGLLGSPAVGSAVLAMVANPAAVGLGAATVVAGALLGIPEPSSVTAQRGVAGHVEAAGASGGLGLSAGLDLDFTGSGLPDASVFGEVSVDAELELGGQGAYAGSAGLRIDGDGVTISLDGRLTVGPGLPPGGPVELRVGVGVEARGELTIPPGVLDGDLLDRLRLGDPRAVAEVLGNAWDEATGRVDLYGVVEGTGGVDAEVVSFGVSGSALQRVGSIDLGG